MLEFLCGGGHLFLGKWECIECGVGMGSGVGVGEWVGVREWRVKPLEPERKNKT